MKETILYQDVKDAQNATLYVFDRTGEINEYRINGPTLIGRDSPTSEAGIRIRSAIASRKHGDLIYLPTRGFVYRDLGSLNGTYVNGVPIGNISPQKRSAVVLKHGDVLRIDHKDLTTTHPEAALILFFLGEQHCQWHEQLLTDNDGRIEIGRDVSKSEGLRLDNEKISRRHATFYRGMNGWHIIDHGSRNGVLLNNTRIDQPMTLHRMDVVRIADTTFIFLGDRILYNAEEAVSNQLQIHIEQRTVRSMFKKHVILQDIDLSINPGEMVLILGGSGAGKSTFMNAVMGYEKADGQIMHGDVDIYKDYDQMKNKIGYVPQQDLLQENDTVFKTVESAADMRMPRGTSAEAKEARIAEVLELLGLTRERNSMVHKLSGGQKKRLSIAVELIADPSLFFLDEPDSGLDGIMATSLMRNLRVIADDGKIVMVITHQPDRVADLFDKVIVLAKSAETNSGHLAFFGSIQEAYAFFQAQTLEQVVKRINRKDEGGDCLSDHYINKFKQYKR